MQVPRQHAHHRCHQIMKKIPLTSPESGVKWQKTQKSLKFFKKRFAFFLSGGILGGINAPA